MVLCYVHVYELNWVLVYLIKFVKVGFKVRCRLLSYIVLPHMHEEEMDTKDKGIKYTDDNKKKGRTLKMSINTGNVFC